MSRGGRLDALLPRYIRLADVRRPDAATPGPTGPLGALLDLIGEQADEIRANTAGLYDDLFIETCAPWAVPYIGDLVGATALRAEPGRRRADVARTLHYRRRKGTLPMLEELARDVTGWPAHAVAFQDLLATTQHLDHLRMEPSPAGSAPGPDAVRRVGTVDLRDMDALDRLGSPFDGMAHTPDLRPPATHEGWHGLRNVGFFLWHIRPHRLTGVPARAVDPPGDHRFRFSPAGVDIPLLDNPDREVDETRLATERHVPGAIRPRAFAAGKAAYYGHVEEDEADVAFAIYRGPAAEPAHLVPARDVVCMDLSGWAPPPRPGTVGVDLRRGRLTVRPGEVPKGGLTVSFHHGFSDELGGGGYERGPSLTPADPGQTVAVAKLAEPAPGAAPPARSLQAAVGAWRRAGRPDRVFRIGDSRTYGGRLAGGTALDLAAGTTVAIEAESGEFPSVRVVGNLEAHAPPEGAELVLNGLLIEGGVTVHGPLRLRMHHCTIVPGRMQGPTGQPASPDRDAIVAAAGSAGAELVADRCILGPLRLPEAARRVFLRDSIVQSLPVAGVERPAIAATDAGAPGPVLGLERATVFGDVAVRAVDEVTDSIVTGALRAELRQVGCLRFSYVGPGSAAPRRFHCAPDEAAGGRRAAPVFASTRYGSPHYARLHRTTPDAIRRGAESGAEMGVFCGLEEALREDDLRERLQEYLPFGLIPGTIDATPAGDRP